MNSRIVGTEVSIVAYWSFLASLHNTSQAIPKFQQGKSQWKKSSFPKPTLIVYTDMAPIFVVPLSTFSQIHYNGGRGHFAPFLVFL